MEDKVADVAIVGAGVIGLAHAYMAARKGLRVVIFDQDEFAVGASVRNFGLIWPVGQEPDLGLPYAMRSRRHWVEIAAKAGFWINQNGSLHVAHHQDEWDVMEEFMAKNRNELYDVQLLNAASTLQKSEVVRSKGLKGSLWSATECTVNPREAIRRIPLWLHEKYGVALKFGQRVKEISVPLISTSVETWKVQKVFVCNGADFQSLYPKDFETQNLIKCSLQMMKASVGTEHDLIGPSLCGGLTLRHYSSFSNCVSLEKLSERYDQENPLFKKHGIHVLVSQHADGDITIGDSHRYNGTIEPFNDTFIDGLILKYLHTFTSFNNLNLKEHWQGIYAKHPSEIFCRLSVDRNVSVINGFGGAGMTLSFGVAEESIDKIL